MRGIYDTVAPRYDGLIAIAERPLFGDGRSWAATAAKGQVLEAAIGTGRNLPYYPADVGLTGVDVSQRMLERARVRAEELSFSVDLHLGDAQRLAFPDASFDTVVTLALCSIPDDRAAVGQMARVLRPGGRLVLLEHVASPNRGVRLVQLVLDPVPVQLAGDHLMREPETVLRDAGLLIEEATRSRSGIVLRLVGRKPR